MTDSEKGPDDTGAPFDQLGDHHGTELSLTESPGEQLRRRRSASYRLPPLASGRRDPWCYHPPAAGMAKDQAAERTRRHLGDLGLMSDVVAGVLSEAA